MCRFDDPVRARSEAARARLLRRGERPLFLAEWTSAVFLHLALEPTRLQPFVRFPLDVREGKAYVSLVAFTMRRMRPRRGGRLLAALTAPLATHPFLNLRTYVRLGEEDGIAFLVEWLPNRLSVWLGPPLYGLPYRHGRCRYDHDGARGEHRGVVRAREGDFAYRARTLPGARPAPVAPGTLDEFLLERYTAYNGHGGIPRRFRVWHEPWPQVPLEVRLEETGLLEASAPWFRGARLVGGHFSVGVRDVWMGPPRRVRGISP